MLKTNPLVALNPLVCVVTDRYFRFLLVTTSRKRPLTPYILGQQQLIGGLTVFDLCTTEHPGRENKNTDVGEDFKVAYYFNSL